MNKKKELQSQQADIHLIVDLPIEAVIEHIASINGDVYRVEIYQHSSDEASFRIRVNRDTISIDTQGIVRRWNGTLTRLDANYDVQRPHFSKRLRPILLWGTSFLVGGGFCAFITEEPLIDALIATAFGFVAVSFLVPFVLWAISLIGGQSRDRSMEYNAFIYVLIEALDSDLKKKAANLAFDGTEADLGRLEQKVAILEFDGTEDELTMLLKQEKYKNFRLGADGEISTP